MSGKQKKYSILLVTFLFPPRGEIGALRAGKIAKYLLRLGHNVQVLTVKEKKYIKKGIPLEVDQNNIHKTYYLDPLFLRSFLGNSKKIEHDSNDRKSSNNQSLYKLIKKFPCTDLARFPDSAIGWYPFAIHAAKKLISNNNFDIIISTSPPPTAHVIASKLSKRYKIPWIADLRDLWSDNPQINKDRSSKIYDKYEKKVISQSKVITTVSEPLKERLAERHDKQVVVIQNGFDHEDYERYVALRTPFTITYTGNIYPNKQNPQILLQAILELKKEGILNQTNFQLRFFGNDHGIVSSEINKYDLNDLIKVNSRIDYLEVVKRQKESSVLLFLDWMDKKQKGVLTGKIFEYIGAGVPILSIGREHSDVSELLNNTGTGYSFTKVNDIKEYLKLSLVDKKPKYNQKNKNNIIDLKKYTRQYQAEQFEDVISIVISQ